MKHKIGDQVKIKSLDWYNANKDADGFVMSEIGLRFTQNMSVLCGTTVAVTDIIDDGTTVCVEHDGFSFWLSPDCIEQQS